VPPPQLRLFWLCAIVLFMIEDWKASASCEQGWCETMGYVGTAGSTTDDGKCDEYAQPVDGCCCLNMPPTNSVDDTTESSTSTTSTTPITPTTTTSTTTTSPTSPTTPSATNSDQACAKGRCEAMGHGITIGSTLSDGTCGGSTFAAMGCCCMSGDQSSTTMAAQSTISPKIPWLYANGRRILPCNNMIDTPTCESAQSLGLCTSLTQPMALNCCWTCWTKVPNFLPQLSNLNGRRRREAVPLALE